MFAVGTVLKKVFGTRNERLIRKMLPLVERINAFEPDFDGLTDEQLKGKTAEFKGRLGKGETLDDLLPEAFAAVRAAAKRTLGLRLFGVQLMGGIALHTSSISEMVTGEGKTLTAVAPAYLNALTGRGVHIVTVNDYLARRDAQWNAPVYGALGLTVGCIQSNMRSDQRIEQYAADITYGTNSEFGFDYLRDNMKSRVEFQCQRDRHFAIIDEVDSILIDEARTPLIISGPTEESSEKYYLADRVVRRWAQGRKGVEKADLDDLVAAKAKGPGPEAEEIRLQLEQDYHFVYSEKQHTAYLTESGIISAQRELGIPDFYAPDVMNENWPHHLEQAVRAHMLYTKEKEYVVKDGEVIIVDEFTGRLMEGRRWSDGLHQAVEAKEAIKIREENQTLATVTIQNFFRLYDKLAGMTGTAQTEAAEFHKIYSLDVLSVPTNRPLKRLSYDDRIYLTEKEKWRSVVEEIVRSHGTGRPVLVGTTSIEANERLSAMLVKRGVQHEVLNAKQHEREAAIIAKAGQLGSVTIATNMAGRGTDILLGDFAYEDLLEHWKRHGLAPKDLRGGDPETASRLVAHWAGHFLKDDPKLAKKADGGDDARRAALEAYWSVHGMMPLPFGPVSTVARLGGLHIIGTERHEARRIDNQLRGRAGRQGDPGSSVFYVSLEDSLMRKFARDWVKRVLGRLGMGDGEEVTSPMVSRAIEKAQKKVEEHNFDIRKNLLEYDKVNDEQRRAIYERRNAILRGEQLEETLWEMIETLLGPLLAANMEERRPPDEWTPTEVTLWARRKFGVEIDAETLRASGGVGPAGRLVRDAITKRIGEVKGDGGEEDFDRTLRYVLLQAFDDKWKEHLRELDALREAVGLRGYAQQDPKVEYRREASQMFHEMQSHIAEAVTDVALKVRVTEDMDQAIRGRYRPAALTKEEVSAFSPSKADEGAPQGSSGEKPEPIRRDTPKVGRNDPCPCGSGRKYKKCHGKEA
ncbi:MAG TPA: preprotein translocase subunit SecA [Planctomycetota bacterium]|nr:preprotein translocase subunit SecA [Planctomycetota bacterium]